MRAAESVLSAHLPGECVLLDLETKRYFRLNATAAEIWKGLEAGQDPEALVERLTAEFEVGAGEARTAVRETLARLDRDGLLQTAGEDS